MRTCILCTLASAGLAASVSAQPVQVRVMVENLSPTDSLSFAPLRVGFGAGVYDSFNEGQAAGAAIVSIAEGGSGSAWFPAFSGAEPGAVLGTVAPNPAGPLLPGASASAEFSVDPSVNRFFTFGAMAVPSNDYFIGNDDPAGHMLFDASGNLNIISITLRARDLWDAGSEVDGPFGAAFLMGQSNDDHLDENGVVTRDFADLSVFNGLTTAAGYTFNSQLTDTTEIYRMSFQIVPAPAAASLLGLVGLGAGLRRKR